jgi:hypothetical protein
MATKLVVGQPVTVTRCRGDFAHLNGMSTRVTYVTNVSKDITNYSCYGIEATLPSECLLPRLEVGDKVLRSSRRGEWTVECFFVDGTFNVHLGEGSGYVVERICYNEILTGNLNKRTESNVAETILISLSNGTVVHDMELVTATNSNYLMRSIKDINV